MNLAWPLVTAVAGLAFVGLAVLAPAKVHRIDMASETDGVHQDDHRILGFVPYSTMRADPNLRVTEDAFHALSRAGVLDLPEAHRRLTSYPVLRLFYPRGTCYVVQFDLRERTARQIADLYASHLSDPVRTHAPFERVTGLCPDGRSRLEFTGPFGPSVPAQLRLQPVSTDAPETRSSHHTSRSGSSP